MPEVRQDQGVVQADGLSIDLASGRVYVNGVEAIFSATEWKLLVYLVRNSGKVIPAQALAVNVWGLNYVESSTIKMCIRRLRQKLGDDTQSPRLIRSYRGRGYSFELKR
jgi:DNA-binding response OmpR family regulator